MSFIIKCKMCGGDIELSSDQSFGTCEFCGSTMTLPKIDDEQRLSAFNRGNHFRRLGEFDKALAVYEHIIQEDETDSEAHWCCALCRFGIEYVHDPSSGEYIPTCHRASFDSFLEDVDYRAAVEHADIVTRKQYEDDAKNIEEVRRDILRISQNEKPYDVFICYKESDDHGQRTVDSQRAQEIYYQLTDQGWRVFFSRITLEDKAGQQYEPYIFAALNSAKVMIVVGTCRENLEAVWVKNEWGRFLAKIKKDRKKLLIPCYANMDPYDMPEQLSVLQSYDMTKIGFIQDLTRGISKVLNADKKQEAFSAKEQSGNVTALIKRGYMSLEDGDWKKADEFFEEVLNQDAECAQAYVGKALASEKCVNLEDFARSRISKYRNKNIPGDRLMVPVAIQHIRDIEKKYSVFGYLDEGTIEELYNFVQESIPQEPYEIFYNTDWEYESQVSYFEKQRNTEDQFWSNNPQLKRALRFADGKLKEELENTRRIIFSDIERCISSAEELEHNCREDKEQKYSDFLDRIDKKVESLYLEACTQREMDYQDACKIQNGASVIKAYEDAIKIFSKMGSFKDAKERIEQCKHVIDKLQHVEEENRHAKEESERKEEVKKIQKIINKYAISIVLLGVALVSVLVLLLNAYYLKINSVVSRYISDKINENANYYEKDFDLHYVYYQNKTPGNGNCYTVVPEIAIFIKNGANPSEEMNEEFTGGSSVLNDVSEGVFSFLGKYIDIVLDVRIVNDNGDETEYQSWGYESGTDLEYFRKTGAPQCYLAILGVTLLGLVVIYYIYKKKLQPAIDKKRSYKIKNDMAVDRDCIYHILHK